MYYISTLPVQMFLVISGGVKSCTIKIFQLNKIIMMLPDKLKIDSIFMNIDSITSR